MKVTILLVSLGFICPLPFFGQVKNAMIEEAKVYGNCAICKTEIEKAGTKKGLYKTNWNVDSKVASITYDSKRTSKDDVLKSIALSGYDNLVYLAPEEAYNRLPSCCKYKRESRIAHDVMNNNILDKPTQAHDHNTEPDNSTPVLNHQSIHLHAVFERYFQLKEALIKSDGPAAAVAASNLARAIDSVEMTTLDVKEHGAWMKHEKKLKWDAQHIKENKDPEHQRGHFMTLSTGMYELIKASTPASTVYYQFCPMANDGKGATWLSKESNIRNPYYGTKMMTCGETTETIKTQGDKSH